MSRWNCGSWMPKDTPLRQSCQIRQLPCPDMPAAMNTMTTSAAKISLLRGSSATRYRSRFSCSCEIGRNGGRIR